MQLIAYRSLYNAISQSSQLTKQISCLAKIKQIYFIERSSCRKQKAKEKDKKLKCCYCLSSFDQVFMLIMHLQIIHYGLVEKYEVKGEILDIIAYQKRTQVDKNGMKYPYINGIIKHNLRHSTPKGYKLDQEVQFVSFSPANLKNRLDTRVKSIVPKIIAKIERAAPSKDRVYFHSTNIFKKIDPQGKDQDSEDEIGEIQRQLEKLRIEDFSDVNDNDKKFFIEWNGFIHERRKKLSIIYAHDMPNLFVQFSGIAQKKGIPRINLVMHAWTLWSVGQINADDVLKGLNQYDENVNESKLSKQAQIVEENRDNDQNKVRVPEMN